jgi:hypothetical protein
MSRRSVVSILAVLAFSAGWRAETMQEKASSKHMEPMTALFIAAPLLESPKLRILHIEYGKLLLLPAHPAKAKCTKFFHFNSYFKRTIFFVIEKFFVTSL